MSKDAFIQATLDTVASAEKSYIRSMALHAQFVSKKKLINILNRLPARHAEMLIIELEKMRKEKE